MSNGQLVHLPPVILAELKKDPKKPTLCIYGHVDVQPAKKEDGWTTDPYTLTEINGNLYGRGASDNKGPVLAWLHAVEAYQALKQEIPVNIKFIIEGMEEAGSNGLDTLTEQRNMTFFSDVDYIVISDNIWISKKPALTYATRGNCFFFVELKCSNNIISLAGHSSRYCGTSYRQPLVVLMANVRKKKMYNTNAAAVTRISGNSVLLVLADSLVDSRGRILVPGINEAVAPLTEEEEKRYQGIEFDLEAHKKDSGVTKFLYDTKLYNYG
ncbi:UNVERIFIED_CONTAM: hypothetical protein FKN15_037722 [Acipenser sinensis]